MSTIQNIADVKSVAQSFQQNGFIGPFSLYDPQEAKEILQCIRIKNLDRSHILFDNDVNYDRHFDISELSRHIGHPGIISRVREIMGPDLLAWRTEFFPKFPGTNGTEWHQVRTYQYANGTPQLLPTEPCDGVPYDLTVWTAFTESTKENGCMKFLPGSHKKFYYDESKIPQTGRDRDYGSVNSNTAFYGYNFEDFKIDAEWQPDESQAVAMEMNAGECVIFTAACVHGSFSNTTKHSVRFAISARYVPTHVRVYPDQKSFRAHGGYFDLSNYGSVLVSGHDKYNHNPIRRENNLGETFPYLR
jgi:non-heme Fe2+,alpha-ketoglutarate-dependent halogenase